MSSVEHVRDAFGKVKRYLRMHPANGLGTDAYAAARLVSGLRVAIEGGSGQRAESDMPVAIGGQSSAPTPGWYVRAGIASCTVSVIALRAAELGVRLDHVEVRVESRSNDCGMVGLDDAVPAGPLAATLCVDIRSEGTPDAQLRELVDWAVAHSPMVDGLTRAVPLAVEVRTA